MARGGVEKGERETERGIVAVAAHSAPSERDCAESEDTLKKEETGCHYDFLQEDE
mgnify:CR=1 FL=1